MKKGLGAITPAWVEGDAIHVMMIKELNLGRQQHEKPLKSPKKRLRKDVS